MGKEIKPLPPPEFWEEVSRTLQAADLRVGDFEALVDLAGYVAASVRKYGVSEQTIYRWRKKYRSFSASEAKRLKALCLVDLSKSSHFYRKQKDL